MTGYLEAVLFKEGDPIKEGRPSTGSSRDLFEAAVEQAEGALERSKAAQALAAVQLQRAAGPARPQLGHRRSPATRHAPPLDQAKGAVTGDEANLQTATHQSRLHRDQRADRRADRPHRA